MTDDEFEQIALTIKAAYPNSNILPDAHSMKVWYRMLGDLEFHIVENAIAEHMSISPFPPSIADIRGKCARRKAEIPDWTEGWERAQKAVRYFGSYRDDEAMESLDEITREAVRRFGYKSMCQSDMKNIETDRAQFREVYNSVARRHIENTQISPLVLEDRENIKRQYIGEAEAEPPLLIDCSTEIEKALSRKAKPDYVAGLMRATRRLFGVEEDEES